MTIPAIPQVSSQGDRPLWSVMIPTYRPNIGMLREAITGPIASAIDRSQMQIALVDDGSNLDWPSTPWRDFLQECKDQGIVTHRFDINVGLAGNWNRCLNLSRGHLIHILHQDDRVRPAFYETIAAGFEVNQKVGAAFTQQIFVTDAGAQTRLGHLEQQLAGVLDNWLEFVFANLAIQCSAMVVRRAVYERVGGFDTSYRYCCDREMWQRIAIEYPIWFDPQPLSDFRVHRNSASASLRRSSARWQELKRCAMTGAKGISPPARRGALLSFRRHTGALAIVDMQGAIRERDWSAVLAAFVGAASIMSLRDVYALVRRQYDRAPPSRAPDRPLDYTVPRNPRILLLTEFFPADPVQSVSGAFQRLRRHLEALNRLGPVDVIFLWPPHRQLSQGDIAIWSELGKQLWPFRGTVSFIATGRAKSLLGRISDAFWLLRGFVGFADERPSMRTCRRQQIASLEQLLRECQPDLIFAHRLSSAVPILRMKSKLPAIIVDFDDLESVRLERLAMSERHLAGRLKATLGAWFARRAERRVCAIASCVLVCSEVELHKVASMSPDAAVANIPNTAASLGDMPDVSQPTAVFIGTAWYPPNREAILWLATEIWPHIRRAVPEAQLVVVGQRTDELGISSPQLGIETLGFVEDLAPIYAQTMLAICPVRRGTGTRIKIIEAAINGRPVVSTTLGAEGLLFEPGTEILIEDEAKEFADACVALFHDPPRASRIGKAAMGRARSTYQEGRVAESLRTICAAALHDHNIPVPDPIGLRVRAVIDSGEKG